MDPDGQLGLEMRQAQQQHGDINMTGQVPVNGQSGSSLATARTFDAVDFDDQLELLIRQASQQG
jgi:hypothetical protein